RERTRQLSLLGRFSEQLAHDLKNPLAALKGALEFLAAEPAGGRSLDAQTEFLELMLEQVRRVERTVTQYQRMAKVEPVLRPGSVNQVVEGVLGLERFAAARNIRLEAELAPDLPSCAIDGDLLAAALDNLLANACEAMPNGGTITVRTERARDAPELLLCVQ